MSIPTADFRSIVGECPAGLKGSFIERALDPDNGFSADGDIPLNAAAFAILFKLGGTNQITTCMDEYCISKEEMIRLLIHAVAAIDPSKLDLDTVLAYSLHDVLREMLLTGEAIYNEIDREKLVQLVATDKDRIFLNKKGLTPLIWACSNHHPVLVLELIATGNSHPDHITASGNTALIVACYNGLSDVALALIATGNSRPDHVGAGGCTALIIACANGLIDVALALIATGNSRPEYITHKDEDEVCNWAGNTALIAACAMGLSDVALALIATGNSLPEYVTSSSETALTYAEANHLADVVAALSVIVP